MKRILILHFIYLILTTNSIGQPSQYKISEHKKIDLFAAKLSTFECHISIDANNKDHFLGVVLSADSTDSKQYFTTWLKSTDNGKTWQSGAIADARAADPWCAILSNRTYAVSDIYNGNKFEQGIRFSDDQGKTWGKTIFLGNGYDHDKMVVDNSGGKYNGNVYLTATRSLSSTERDPHIRIARLNNKGQLLSEKRYHPFKNVNLSAQQPAITSDGSVLIPVTIRGAFPAGASQQIPFTESSAWLIKSNDGVNTFSPPMFITPVTGPGHHILALNKSEKSKDHLYYFFTGNKTMECK